MSFYTKVAVLSFCLGAGMEYFMIRTGFYDKVVEIEAERLQDHLEEREQFLKDLQEHVQRQKKQS
ncbi:hypothetical protein PSENEW3_00001014 [Picochlorum sp. SENEW3]|nr:hypothetical protein PSENEW3_00001014 [Picochlorum sp. SENEW3]